MTVHRPHFANTPATETNSIDCRGFPQQNTNTLLPRSVFVNILVIKGLHSRWIWGHDTQHKYLPFNEGSSEYPTEEQDVVPTSYCHRKHYFSKKKEFYDNRFTNQPAQVLEEWSLYSFLLYIQCLLENWTMTQILRKRYFMTYAVLEEGVCDIISPLLLFMLCPLTPMLTLPY